VSDPAFDRPYPVQLDLRGRRALVVGAGPVAAHKVDGLRRAGAVVTVVAPDAVPEIAGAADVRWHRRPYRRGEAASYRLAITATDDPVVNRQVARDGEAANVFVNSADDPANCSFILPAVLVRGDLQVSVSTNGRSPAFARWARRRIAELLTDVHASALDVVSDVRDDVRAEIGTSEVDGWDEILDDPRFLDLVAAGRLDDARRLVRSGLDVRRAR